MIVLGIDTSCDDTSVGIVSGTRVLANVISSQDNIHRSWGGVVPNLARRGHEENWERVFTLALRRARLTMDNIDAVAVTQGPGLAIALGVGIDKAQQLATAYAKPLYAVNHMEGHLLACLAQRSNADAHTTLPFPALGVLVSGNHAELVRVTGLGRYTRIGGTVDDAFGEAFDKTARLLGLGFPGGALLAQLAEHGNPQAFVLPRAMRHTDDLNISYSGLKTAVVKLTQSLMNSGQVLTSQVTADVAASFQAAAVETLTYKVGKALQAEPYTSIMLGGGASPNLALRRELRRLTRAHHIPLLTPYTKKLCQDNGAMIALVPSLYATYGQVYDVAASVDRRARWEIGTE